MQVLTAKKLIIEVTENDDIYTFPVFEFDNGLIMVACDSTHNLFFKDQDSIQASGIGIVSDIFEEDEVVEEWTTQELAKALTDSARQFGYDEAIQKGWELIKSSR